MKLRSVITVLLLGALSVGTVVLVDRLDKKRPPKVGFCGQTFEMETSPIGRGMLVPVTREVPCVAKPGG